MHESPFAWHQQVKASPLLGDSLMHLLGFRFAPRIRNLGDTKLFIPKGDTSYDALARMISSDRLDIRHIHAHWDDIRLWHAGRKGSS